VFLEFMRDNCVNSPNFMIAQRAMMLLNNRKIQELLATHARQVVVMLGRTLLETATEHWNDTSRQMAYQIACSLSKNEPALAQMQQFKELVVHYEAFEAQERVYEQQRLVNMKQKKTNVAFNDFALSKKLGDGAFARVYLAVRIDHSGVPQRHWETYAIKEMDLSLLEAQNYVDRAREEARILSSIEHPNIVALLATFETETKLSLVLEYCPGGMWCLHSLTH
jgi:hypothetical protein